MSTTIRVSEPTRARISALAAATHRPMTAVVDDALDALDRERFFEAFNSGYRRLRDDDAAWAEVESERQLESSALGDLAS